MSSTIAKRVRSRHINSDPAEPIALNFKKITVGFIGQVAVQFGIHHRKSAGDTSGIDIWHMGKILVLYRLVFRP